MFCCFPQVILGAGWKVEQQEHELGSIWDAGIEGFNYYIETLTQICLSKHQKEIQK